MEQDKGIEDEFAKYRGAKVEFVHLGIPYIQRQLMQAADDPRDLPTKHAIKVRTIYKKIDTLRAAGIKVIDIGPALEDVSNILPGETVWIGGGARDECVQARKEYVERAGGKAIIDDSITWEGY